MLDALNILDISATDGMPSPSTRTNTNTNTRRTTQRGINTRNMRMPCVLYTSPSPRD